MQRPAATRRRTAAPIRGGHGLHRRRQRLHRRRLRRRGRVRAPNNSAALRRRPVLQRRRHLQRRPCCRSRRRSVRRRRRVHRRCNEAADNCSDAAGTACTDDGNVCTDDVCDGAGACAAATTRRPAPTASSATAPTPCSGGTCSRHTGDPCTGGAECSRQLQRGRPTTAADLAGTACARRRQRLHRRRLRRRGRVRRRQQPRPATTASSATAPTCAAAASLRSRGRSVHRRRRVRRRLRRGARTLRGSAGTACTEDGNACTDDACDGAGAARRAQHGVLRRRRRLYERGPVQLGRLRAGDADHLSATTAMAAARRAASTRTTTTAKRRRQVPAIPPLAASAARGRAGSLGRIAAQESSHVAESHRFTIVVHVELFAPRCCLARAAAALARRWRDAGTRACTLPDCAIEFGASNAVVTFGNTPALGLASFTVEAWLNRAGHGHGGPTRLGRHLGAIPLVDQGPRRGRRPTPSTELLLRDPAPDGRAGAPTSRRARRRDAGLNHPVAGATPIALGTWHHAAATYDGTTWRLYLDGAARGDARRSASPRADSIQHAALGTALRLRRASPQGASTA